MLSHIFDILCQVYSKVSYYVQWLQKMMRETRGWKDEFGNDITFPQTSTTTSKYGSTMRNTWRPQSDRVPDKKNAVAQVKSNFYRFLVFTLIVYLF